MDRRLSRSGPPARLAALFFALAVAPAPLLLAADSQAEEVVVEQLIKVTPLTKADQLRIFEMAPEARACGVSWSGDALQFSAPATRAAELSAAGFAVEVVIADLSAFYLQRMEAERLATQGGPQALGGGDFGEYHTYTEAIATMDALQASYPSLMKPKESIGTTIEGRTIWVYKLSDNPLVDEDEPEVFFNAYIHAREAITFEVVHDLAEHLLSSYGTDSRATNILDTREIWIQPVVNPDGVERNRTTNPGGGGLWRKNRRNNGGGSFGVDLNRNFGAFWGFDNNGSSGDPNGETYRGTGPFSEPETQAIRTFVNSRQFKIAINYHSYSNLNLFSYGFEVGHAPDYDELLALGQQRKIGNGYDTGAAWEVLYPVNGDANDWMYAEEIEKPKIFAYVTEVGNLNDGFWPLESRIPALVAENREGNLRVCELADNPYRALRPRPPIVLAPPTTGGSFTVSFGFGGDPNNAPVSWNLIEGTGYTLGLDTVEGTLPTRWDPNDWSVSTARSNSPTHSWYSGTGDNSNNTLTSLRAYKVQPGDQLQFRTWYRTESNFDYGYVEISTDGGLFTSLPGNFTTNNDPNARNLGNGITGNSSGWKLAIHDLSAYVGQTVWLRFRYSTDGGVTEEGWYVDDISPSELFANEAVVATGLPSAQYSFTNHPEGQFWYLAQAVDGEGQGSVWSAPRAVTVEATTGVDSEIAMEWGGLELAGPNPIQGSTGLRFVVPVDARAGDLLRLAIYDVSGREHAVLVDGRVGGAAELGVGRSLERRWTPAEVIAGVYFARLTVGARTSEKRLVVID